MFSMASDMDLREEKDEIAQGREKILKVVYGSVELDKSYKRTFAGVSLLQFKKEKCEKDKIVVKEALFLQSRVPTVQGYFAEENSETLALSPIEIEEQVLRDFLGYDPIWKDGSWVEGTIMSIAGLDICMATAVRFLAVNKRWMTPSESVRRRIPKNGGDCDKTFIWEC